jgi:RNA exonuclease 1
MFSSLGLFQNLACPDKDNCSRPRCIFSHRTDLPSPPPLYVPFDETKANPPIPRPSGSTVPEKRPATHSPHSSVGLNNGTSISEPARKLKKLSLVQNQSVVPSTSHTSVSEPYFNFDLISILLIDLRVRQELRCSESMQLDLK